MKPAYQTVIFDIDGTLLKSDRGVMNALKYTTEKMGVPYPCLLYTSCGQQRKKAKISGGPESKLIRAHIKAVF